MKVSNTEYEHENGLLAAVNDKLVSVWSELPEGSFRISLNREAARKLHEVLCCIFESQGLNDKSVEGPGAKGAFVFEVPQDRFEDLVETANSILAREGGLFGEDAKRLAKLILETVVTK